MSGTDTGDVGEELLPALDPVIHASARLRVTVALAILEAADQIAFPRLQQLVGRDQPPTRDSRDVP